MTNRRLLAALVACSLITVLLSIGLLLREGDNRRQVHRLQEEIQTLRTEVETLRGRGP